MKQSRSDYSEYYDSLHSPIGALFLVFAQSALIGITFAKPSSIVPRQTKDSTQAKKELEEYFAVGRAVFTVKTRFVGGTDFEREVWETLRGVQYGETKTYKWVAERIGKPHAFRAVGNALGKNPIPIIFPCHRIIESDGSLGGYSSGIDIKRRLLEMEYYTKLSRT